MRSYRLGVGATSTINALVLSYNIMQCPHSVLVWFIAIDLVATCVIYFNPVNFTYTNESCVCAPSQGTLC